MATISNSKNATLVSGTSGNDSINNHGYNVTIDGGIGNDTINNGDYHEVNPTKNVTILGGAGNDSIYNMGKYTYVDAGDGDDTIASWARDASNVDYAMILGGDGNDVIDGISSYATINCGKDNDTVRNFGSNVSIFGGSGNDSLVNTDKANNVTINGGDGNDTVEIWAGSSILSDLGDGNDFFTDRNGESTNVNVNGGTGDDTIECFASKSTINGGSGKDTIRNSGDNVTIDGGAGDDYIYNNGDETSIVGGAGKDTIVNYIGNDSTIAGGKGDDLISLGSSWLDNVIEYKSGDGNDTIIGLDKYSTLSISGGECSTTKSGKNIIVTVNKGKITLVGVADLDSVNISVENYWTLSGTTAKYGTRDKTLLTVKGVKSLDGLSLKDTVVTVAKSSLNATKVTISDGYKLKLASDVSSPKTKKAAWSFSDSTATYKGSSKTAGYKLASNGKSISYSKATSAKTLITVKGVKSLDGLSLNDKVVTVAKSSLNATKVTISDGYTLKLASDVTSPTTKKAAWSLSNSTATYKSSYKTAGYTLASDGKSISYSKATTATGLATIKGAASTSGLSVSGKKITMKKSALKTKVTIGGGYEFNFASDYAKSTITGSKNADTITTNGSSLSISGGAGNDTIKTLGSKNTIKGGDGADLFIFSADKSNVISDYTAEDKISITGGTAVTTANGNDLILTVEKGKITVKNGNDNKTVTYSDEAGEHTYSARFKDVKMDGKKITLLDSYMEDNFDVADYGTALQTIDASAVVHTLNIKGNKLINYIIGSEDDDTIDGGAGKDTILGGEGNDSLFGGKGNDSLYGGAGTDTLTGGEGADVFVYNSGDGKNTMTDYTSGEDIISLDARYNTDTYSISKNGSVVLKFGSGTLTIEDAKYEAITFFDGDKYFTKRFDVLELNNNSDVYKTIDDNVEFVDATARTIKIEITGNAKNNTILGGTGVDTIYGESGDDSLCGGNDNDVIYGGDGDDTLIGGKGNDSLYGGAGDDTLIGGKGNDKLWGDDNADTFVYNSGDGKDKIYDFRSDDMLEITGAEFKAFYHNDGYIYINVGDTKNAITFSEGSITTNIKINGDTYVYKESEGNQLIKK